MQVVILAGGFGTRISEESTAIPKPMITIGGKPILWHIMKTYSHYGHKDFIICLGYKGNMIREYFSHFSLYNSDVTFDYHSGDMITHRHWKEEWKVTLVETGLNTMTGGRVKRIEDYIENDTFLLTYGDGVADIDINKSIAFHQESQKLLTLTAVQLQPRFGALKINDAGTILEFKEKNKLDQAWINGGFMVAERGVFDYLNGDMDVFEKEPMIKMVGNGQVSAYKHYNYWQPMDTLRERQELEAIWASGRAPWKVWEDHE